MKYELEPDNRNCSDEELLADLKKIADQLGIQSLSQEEYNKHGRFSSATIKKRLGWNKALLLAGLEIKKRNDIPEAELLDDLKDVSEKLGSTTVTSDQYSMHGKFSTAIIQRKFGNWSVALDKAGLDPTGYKYKITDDALFDNMASIWELVGRQPKQKDFDFPTSRCKHDVYVRRFGSWRTALEAFVKYMNSEQENAESKKEIQNIKIEVSAYEQKCIHKTERDPSWRLRFLVMRRDNFACRFCGASPAKNPSVNLHIDHIHAWARGGETVLENLQTLCDVCNIGKSDLSMTPP